MERFFKEVAINGRKASADGLIKAFPLRDIKDSLHYLHDGRLLMLAERSQVAAREIGELASVGRYIQQLTCSREAILWYDPTYQVTFMVG